MRYGVAALGFRNGMCGTPRQASSDHLAALFGCARTPQLLARRLLSGRRTETFRPTRPWAIAGLLVQWFGANACFLFDSFSFFFSAAMVMTLTIHRAPSPGAAASSVLASMRQGFSFIFTHAAISFVILAMTAGMFAVRCFGALLSVYVRDVLLSNAALFGTLNSLIGVCMITGTQFLHRVASRVPQQFLVTCRLGGMGMAILITALFGKVATTAIGMLGLGIGAAFIMVPSQTPLQRRDAARFARPRDEQPDVAIGHVTGAGYVRGRPGGAAVRHPQAPSAAPPCWVRSAQ